jgi:hypothetical protein
MSVKFTKHALQRIKSRNISKDDVLDTIDNPKNVINDSYGNLIAQKMKGKYLLRVFYFIEGESKVIITAYKTTKVKKFI